MVINGLRTDNNISECVKQVEVFFENTLEIEINIVDCFKLGFGPDKPVVVQLELIVARTLIQQAMESYSQMCDEERKDQTIFIKDYIPAEIKERRRKDRDIYHANEQDQVNRVDMAFDKGKLTIQGEIH